MSVHELGLDILGGHTTLGPRGRNTLLGADVEAALFKAEILGVSVKAWDNADSYASGDVVYHNLRYYRAVRDVSSPILSVLFDGDVPGQSDAWHEITEAQAYAPSNTVLGLDDIMIGEAIDVNGLVERFATLPPTNRTVWSLWVENSHGLALAQRVTADAQSILSQALVPTNEFTFHDAVEAFAKRAQALSDKVTAQPLDDNSSPVWNDVKAYFVDGSNLANQLENVLNQSVKWSDVKEAANKAAKGAGDAIDTAKWTAYALTGGAVLLGVGALYVVYKIATGPAGGAIVGGYLGMRR